VVTTNTKLRNKREKATGKIKTVKRLLSKLGIVAYTGGS
jgi:hypothetical protein